MFLNNNNKKKIHQMRGKKISLGKTRLCNFHTKPHTMEFTPFTFPFFSPKVIKIRAKSWLKKKAEIYNTAISFLKRRKAKEREATNQAGKAKLFCISLAMTTTTKSF